jgi:SAM-dependent methyltransferase
VTSTTYVGSELDVFADAVQWKGYVRRQLRPYLHGRVLEVGAGIGTTTAALHSGRVTEWVCLEPDPALVARLEEARLDGRIPAACQVVQGTTRDVSGPFDLVLYVDVLEHIEHDRDELERAASLLAPGGVVAVLAPAHPWLFTPFDEAIGHFRRYTRASLLDVGPYGAEPVVRRYLDSVGLLASLGNRLLLRSSMPSSGQVRFWDRVLVRASRLLDPLARYHLGKSVLVAWRQRGTPRPE